MMMKTDGGPRNMAVRVGRVTLATAVAAVMTVSLSGCFANPMEKLMEQGAGKIVEQVTGGGLDVGTSGEMPKDFPGGIPLVSADVVGSSSLTIEGSKTWTVQVKTGGSVADVSERIRGDFSAAGWEEAMWMDSGLSGGMFTSTEYSALISLFEDDDSGGTLVNYVVSETQDDE